MKTQIFHSGVFVGEIDDRRISDCILQNIERVRNSTSEAISSAGLDTATQQNAALGIYSPERCEAIKNYIASCRNEYLRCKGLILAATSNNEADSVTFIAPSVEEGL